MQCSADDMLKDARLLGDEALERSLQASVEAIKGTVATVNERKRMRERRERVALVAERLMDVPPGLEIKRRDREFVFDQDNFMQRDRPGYKKLVLFSDSVLVCEQVYTTPPPHWSRNTPPRVIQTLAISCMRRSRSKAFVSRLASFYGQPVPWFPVPTIVCLPFVSRAGVVCSRRRLDSSGAVPAPLPLSRLPQPLVGRQAGVHTEERPPLQGEVLLHATWGVCMGPFLTLGTLHRIS